MVILASSDTADHSLEMRLLVMMLEESKPARSRLTGKALQERNVDNRT